jgi:hypothetical protein
MIGLGRVKIERGVSNGNVRIPADFILVSGEVWNNPGDARKGEPGMPWAIAMNDGAPQELILVGNENFAYFLLDRTLLAKFSTYNSGK